jgi:hypothetical protein
MAEISETEVRAGLCALVTVQATNLGVEIALPIVLPNGEATTVVVNPDGDGFLVHDASAAISYLNSEGMKIGTALRGRLTLSASRYGCHLIGNRVGIRGNHDQLPFLITAVANASRAVADHALEMRRPSDGDFREVVLDHLRSFAGSRVRENQQIKGASGRVYKVPGLILDRAERQPVAFISTISNRASIPTQLTELFDLKNAHEAIDREAIYDERSDLREEDKRLMEKVSEIVPFAQTRRLMARFFDG